MDTEPVESEARGDKTMENIDPEEICVNCYAKVNPYVQKCPFCGKTWWIRKETEDDSIRRTEAEAPRD
jgi:rRNA maturation endonuclease Nob1